MKKSNFKNIPSIQKISEQDEFIELTKLFSRDLLINELRIILNIYRESKHNDKVISMDSIFNELESHMKELLEEHPKKIINASGVILQTNFGRAPLPNQAVIAMQNISTNYSDLEYDLKENKRGGRLNKLKKLINRLTNAEDALVVNNNASAVFLVLKALCSSKEVLVSRSESVEIGGGFRVPDVITESNAILIDVGTTNKTYVKDYESKITANTGCILLIHQSNFKIEGFTFKPSIKDIVEMAKKNSVPVFYDLGSGCLIDTTQYSLEYEPTVKDAISDGVDLVFFSGDKLIGGPQAGIIAGKKEYIQIIENHPLTRALRLDKVLLSALNATLQLYLSDKYKEIPLWNILNKKNKDIYNLVENWKENLNKNKLSNFNNLVIFEVCKSSTMIGGGSIPEQSISSYSLVINCEGLPTNAETINKCLKSRNTPILTRIKDNKLYIDPLTILHDEENSVFTALNEEMKNLDIVN